MQIIVKKLRVFSFVVTGFFLFMGLPCSNSLLIPTAAAEENSSAEELKLETVTVTAEKREEDVQKVTASTSVISDITIEDAGIQSTRDLRGQIPNFKTTHNGSRDYWSSIHIRGISNTAIGDPSVAIYIDDISYADVYSFNLPLFDIKRVEVLKGPQGTLYGKNTEGGAINIHTKQPTNQWENKARLEVGDYNFLGLSALVNGPLIKDRLFFRFAGLKSSRDGYVKNIYTDKQIDNQDTTSARASLIYKPSSDWEVRLTSGMNKYEDDGGYPMVPQDKSKYKSVTGISDLKDFEVANDYEGESSVENSSTSLKIAYRGNSFDILSITGHRRTENSGTMDGDFRPVDGGIGFADWKSSAVSQEFRIKSKDENSSLKWLFGGYYSDEKKEIDTGFIYGAVYAALYGYPTGTKDVMSATLTAKNSAVFGQVTPRFLNDKLGLTAGLRYENSSRGMDRSHTIGGTLSAQPIEDMSKNYSITLPKAGIDFRFDEDKMIYFTAAKGYKAGGFSYAADDPDLAEFDPEISNALELGFKSEFLDNGVRLNIAVFGTKVEDYQDRIQLSPTNVIQVNAPEVSIHGLETELTIRLTESLTLDSMLGITKATYIDYIDPSTGENYEGNSVALTPEHNSGLFLSYRGESGVFSRLEIQHTGEYYLTKDNDPKQDPYTIANVKAGYEADDWDIYLSVKNITNKQYILGGYEDYYVGFVGTTGDPRTIRLAGNYRF